MPPYIDVPEPPQKRFLKMAEVFTKIGDSFVGVYVGDFEGQYGQDYIFSIDGCEGACLTLKGGLKAQLQAAKAAGLKPGGLCAIQFAKEIPTRHDNPKRSFKVKVDPDHKGPPPKNGKNVLAAIKAANERAEGTHAPEPMDDDAGEDPFA